MPPKGLVLERRVGRKRPALFYFGAPENRLTARRAAGQSGVMASKIRPTPRPGGPALVRPALGALLLGLSGAACGDDGGNDTTADTQPPMPASEDGPMPNPTTDDTVTGTGSTGVDTAPMPNPTTGETADTGDSGSTTAIPPMPPPTTSDSTDGGSESGSTGPVPPMPPPMPDGGAPPDDDQEI